MSVLKRIMLMGVGAASMTKEKAEEMVEDLIKRGELAAGDRAKAIDEIQQKTQAAAGEVKKMVEDQVDALSKKLKWIDDMRKIQTQVQDLNARLESLEKKLAEREGQTK